MELLLQCHVVFFENQFMACASKLKCINCTDLHGQYPGAPAVEQYYVILTYVTKHVLLVHALKCTR